MRYRARVSQQQRRGGLWAFVGPLGGVGVTWIVLSVVWDSGNDEAFRVVGVGAIIIAAALAVVAVKRGADIF